MKHVTLGAIAIVASIVATCARGACPAPAAYAKFIPNAPLCYCMEAPTVEPEPIGYAGHWHDPSNVRAPEIDPSSGVSAVTVLALFLMIISDRRPRQ